MVEHIFHYTSIETLALILKSQSIRFNNLKNVDDLNETQFSDDNINLSSNTLISCWTKNEDENLAFWNMYTPNMKGVRIKMSKNLFELYEFDTEGIIGASKSIIKDSLVPKSEAFNENYWILTFGSYLSDVIYTDDPDLLKPSIYHEDDERFTARVGEIGKYKSTIWEFQQEIRFKLFVLPTKDSDGNSLNPLIDIGKIIFNDTGNPLEHYDIKIKDEAFKNMEITLGPRCTFAEGLIVQALVDKYNPSAVTKKNRLEGIIR